MPGATACEQHIGQRETRVKPRALLSKRRHSDDVRFRFVENRNDLDTFSTLHAHWVEECCKVCRSVYLSHSSRRPGMVGGGATG